MHCILTTYKLCIRAGHCIIYVFLCSALSSIPWTALSIREVAAAVKGGPVH